MADIPASDTQDDVRLRLEEVARQEDRELSYLLAEYKTTNDEMSRRHNERYKFHTLSFVLLAAMGALLGINPTYLSVKVKIITLAVAPLAYTVIMGLMLKEHQYINMRDRYLEIVLRPRFEQLAAGFGGSRFSWTGWQEYEHLQMGRQKAAGWKERWLVFAVLGMFDYAIPILFTLGSLLAYWYNYPRLYEPPALPKNEATIIHGAAIFNLIFFLLVTGWMLRLRFKEQRWFT